MCYVLCGINHAMVTARARCRHMHACPAMWYDRTQPKQSHAQHGMGRTLTVSGLAACARPYSMHGTLATLLR